MDPYYNRVTPRHLSPAMLDLVLSRGWYRMRQDIFTISHLSEETGYYRVHWLRYNISKISDRNTHRRIRKNHPGYKVTFEPLSYIPESHRNLHRKYRKWIDFDGVRTIEEGLFGSEVITNIFPTWSLSVYEGEQLVAAGYFDVGDTSVASILHFFDPEHRWSSPGKFLILCTLDWMRSNNKNWYYPGYVVAGKPKMDYKLFIGESDAEFFDPVDGQWKVFDRRILDERPILLMDPELPEADEMGDDYLSADEVV